MTLPIGLLRVFDVDDVGCWVFFFLGQGERCRQLWSDYVALIRTRLVDLGPTTQQVLTGKSTIDVERDATGLSLRPKYRTTFVKNSGKRMAKNNWKVGPEWGLRSGAGRRRGREGGRSGRGRLRPNAARAQQRAADGHLPQAALFAQIPADAAPAETHAPTARRPSPPRRRYAQRDRVRCKPLR